ncbi:hypothetical protein ACFQZ2_10085 [Streptomonospora algeriensis]|uniref:Uncharacterized protein n=1 Tax=Streptomonospora algeriensis TaxID=995084 RepID=A0ABW3BB76_9ACTN
MADGKDPGGPAAETAGAQAAHGGKAGEEKHTRSSYRYIRGYQGEGGDFAPSNAHRGRLASWLSVLVFLAGFTLGGVGLSLGVHWWLIGIGLAMMAVAGVLFLVADIFTDVVLDDPRQEAEEPHNTPLHRIKAQDRRRAEAEGGQRAASDDHGTRGDVVG